jgi:hypothetical protein
MILTLKMNTNEGVYLIHTRELHTLQLPIYKLGRSHTLDNRIIQYPKRSKILFIMNCEDSIIFEKYLIKLFKKKFIQKTEYGTEYFEGDKDDMIREIFNYIDNKKCIKNDVKKDINNSVKKDIKKDIKDVKKNVKNVKDRTCPKCETKFEYPSLLKRHFTISSRCTISNEEIELFFNPIINSISCNTCNKTFTRKCSLQRHLSNSKCKRNQVSK